ncbi:AarF/UbiB family protein [Streptomyces sp. NPDC005865]|uniref:ABC1 kinase family protein n=1 Tax=Streptomyces sp. NPDC005865 TaxID=3155453 RepID=UPI0034049545
MASAVVGLAAHEAREALTRVYRGTSSTAVGPASACSVRRALENLGPLYIKLGQLMSTRPDLIPDALVRELASLHDRVHVLPFAAMEPILRDSLGPAWRTKFEMFDEHYPLGSASIAQVYAARLRGGAQVVVKVQRPGVADTARDDMRILRALTRLFARRARELNERLGLENLLEAFFQPMAAEFDFTAEARNMEEAQKVAAKFQRICVPQVIEVTPHVLIQSRADGTSVEEAQPADFEPEVRCAIGRELMGFMCEGYFLNRFFHADPHPGNVFVDPGGCVTLLDWGMVGRVDRRLSLSLLSALVGLAQNDAHAVSRSWAALSHRTRSADLSAFRQDLSLLVPQIHFASLGELDFGAKLTQLLMLSTRRGIQTHPMIALLGRSFANLEGSVRRLAPELSLVNTFTALMPHLVEGFVKEAISPAQRAHSTLELVAAHDKLLGNFDSFADDLAAGTLAFRADAGKDAHTQPAHRIGACLGSTLRTLVCAFALYEWRRRNREAP